MRLSLIIPFYNEEKNVSRVLDETVTVLEDATIDYEIIAVQNGSWDGTSELIDRARHENDRIKKFSIEVNQGLGWGIISGLRQAEGDIVGWICGDGQVEGKHLVEVYRLAEEKGTRGIYKINRIQRFDGFKRRFISATFNGMMKVMFDVDTRDANATPKLFGKDVFEEMELVSKDWFIDSEIMIKARRLGIPTHEVPAIFNERQGGASNIRLTTSLEFLKNLLRFYIKR